MSETRGSVRQRKKRATTPLGGSSDDEIIEQAIAQKQQQPLIQHRKPKPANKTQETGHKIALAVVTVLGFITRFYKINHPDQVVFDEVHFGKV